MLIAGNFEGKERSVWVLVFCLFVFKYGLNIKTVPVV